MATPARPAYAPPTPTQGMTPEEAKYRVKLLDTLDATLVAGEKLIGGQQRAESQRYSTVVNATAKLEAAKQSGSVAAATRAAADLRQPLGRILERTLAADNQPLGRVEREPAAILRFQQIRHLRGGVYCVVGHL